MFVRPTFQWRLKKRKISRLPGCCFPIPGDSDRLALSWSASVYIPAATIAEHFGELGGRWQKPPLSNKAHQGLGRATALRQNWEIPPTSVFVWGSFRASLGRAIYSPYSLRQQTPDRAKYGGVPAFFLLRFVFEEVFAAAVELVVYSL